MALSSEDKADVKGAMGKAIANKVSKVTRDGNKRPAGYWSKGVQSYDTGKMNDGSYPEFSSKKPSAKSKALSKKVGLKSLGESMGFDKTSKVLQGRAKKHGNKVVHLRGFDKAKRRADNRKPVKADDIPS